NAMLFVHDVITWRQLQRIDAAPSPARHAMRLPRARPRAREVLLSDDDEPDRWPDEARLKQPGRHVSQACFGTAGQIALPRAQPATAKESGPPSCGPLPPITQPPAPASPNPAVNAGQCPAGAPAVAGCRYRRYRERARLATTLEGNFRSACRIDLV